MEVTIVFSSKKAYNKFMRNYRNGKGTNIKPDDVEIVGAGFLDGLKKAGRTVASGAKSVAQSDIGKALIKEGIKAGKQGATAALVSRGVNPQLAMSVTDIGAKAANKQVDGMGFLSNLKNAGKNAIKSDLAKSLGKLAVNEGFNQLNNQMAQRGYSNNITNALSGLAQKEMNSQISGMGFGGDGLSQSVQNMHSERMARVRSYKKGGSFRLPG
jgi:hypothetical protein